MGAGGYTGRSARRWQEYWHQSHSRDWKFRQTFSCNGQWFHDHREYGRGINSRFARRTSTFSIRSSRVVVRLWCRKRKQPGTCGSRPGQPAPDFVQSRALHDPIFYQVMTAPRLRLSKRTDRSARSFAPTAFTAMRRCKRLYAFYGTHALLQEQDVCEADNHVAQRRRRFFQHFQFRSQGIYQLCELRLSSALSSGRAFAFGKDSGTTSGKFTGSENAYLYQAYSNDMEHPHWNGATCPYGSIVPRCVAPFITRTGTAAPFTYSQDGYQIVQGQNTLANADHSHYPAGWADLTDGTGAGIEVGIYQMSSYWPKSLQFQNGGSEIRVGIWPDQSLFPG